MVLSVRRWGESAAEAVFCVHGIGQHGGVFESLAQQLAEAGHYVISVDLRGHGESSRQPPWTIETHVGDLLETVNACGVRAGTWIGHSFGGLLVASVAADVSQSVRRIVLLDPGMEIPSERAQRGSAIEGMDWSFQSVDGAVNALMSAEAVVATPRSVVEGYAEDALERGSDGRWRFGYSSAAASAAWLELRRPAPPIAAIPTLIVRPATGLVNGAVQDARYVRELGSLARVVNVPNGHNVLWESPAETVAAVKQFLLDS